MPLSVTVTTVSGPAPVSTVAPRTMTHRSSFAGSAYLIALDRKFATASSTAAALTSTCGSSPTATFTRAACAESRSWRAPRRPLAAAAHAAVCRVSLSSRDSSTRLSSTPRITRTLRRTTSSSRACSSGKSLEVEQVRRSHRCAELVLQLVRERAVEAAQPVLALGELRPDALHVVRERCLLDERDCAKHAMAADEQLVFLARLRRASERAAGEEGEDDPAEDLELLQQLVFVEPLPMAQRAKLHRFRDHRRVGRDYHRRILEIRGNAVDEQRDMVQQFIGRKNPHRIELDARRDPLEPTLRELFPLLAHAAGEGRCKRAREQ